MSSIIRYMSETTQADPPLNPTDRGIVSVILTTPYILFITRNKLVHNIRPNILKLRNVPVSTQLPKKQVVAVLCIAPKKPDNNVVLPNTY